MAFLSWFNSRYFITELPASGVPVMTNAVEIPNINSCSGGTPSVNIKENYHIDKSGYADKTPVSKNIENFEMNVDRAAGTIYTASGTDYYSVLRNWQENNGDTHKALVVITKVKAAMAADSFEAAYYDVVPAGMTEGERNGDDVQNFNMTLAVSGPRQMAYVTATISGGQATAFTLSATPPTGGSAQSPT